MKKFKISQIQFQAKPTPKENAELLIKLFQQAQKFKPNLICTPECSNIITYEKKVKVLQYQVPEDKDTQLLVNFLASYYIYL